MPDHFQPTRWSLIQQINSGEAHLREDAWREFDALYRAPLLAFVRRSGWSAEESEDLLQGFLAKLAARDWLKVADPDRGKMRTFLLNRLKSHLNDARKIQNAQKRGGGQPMVALDESQAAVPAENFELEFDREWARAILNRVLTTLEARCQGKLKNGAYMLLQSQLTDDSPEKLRSAAEQLGESEDALRGQLHRLREQFRLLLRKEVAETLLPGEDVSSEMRYLARILG